MLRFDQVIELNFDLRANHWKDWFIQWFSSHWLTFLGLFSLYWKEPCEDTWNNMKVSKICHFHLLFYPSYHFISDHPTDKTFFQENIFCLATWRILWYCPTSHMFEMDHVLSQSQFFKDFLTVFWQTFLFML